jgi:hypothetical protein
MGKFLRSQMSEGRAFLSSYTEARLWGNSASSAICFGVLPLLIPKLLSLFILERIEIRIIKAKIISFIDKIRTFLVELNED